MYRILAPLAIIMALSAPAFASSRMIVCKAMPDQIAQTATAKVVSADTKEALSLRDKGVALCDAGNAHDAKEKFMAAFKLLGVDPNQVASSK